MKTAMELDILAKLLLLNLPTCQMQKQEGRYEIWHQVARIIWNFYYNFIYFPVLPGEIYPKSVGRPLHFKQKSEISFFWPCQASWSPQRKLKSNARI